jgi:hypothetical protein
MTLAARDRSDGYVIDIAYLPGYYRQQSRSHLNLACLLGGVAGIDSSPASSLSYLELGCGYGFSALVLAAANPRWQVTGNRLQSGPRRRCASGSRREATPGFRSEAQRLREADLNVFSKLGNQGLERRLEAEAFAGREVGGEDDLLDFLVGCLVDIQVARQPST